MNLAQKIQKNRRARGMTQEELAAAIGVSHQSISKWESNQATPGLDKVLLLSTCFGVSTDYLLRDEMESCDPPLPLSLPARRACAAHASRYPIYVGMLFLLAGCAGAGFLLVHSLLNPPYTFGESLGHVQTFFFYIRYNEFEMHLRLSLVALLIGLLLVLLGLLWRYKRKMSRALRRSAPAAKKA